MNINKTMDLSSLFLHVAVPAPLPQLFSYLPPENCKAEDLCVGARVKVPFGKRNVIGIIVKINAESTIARQQLKTALEVLDQTSLFSEQVFALLQWASDYYHAPIGEVFAAALPVLLRDGKALVYKKIIKVPVLAVDQVPQLNSHQQQAINAVLNSLKQFQAFLLDGVTGSGKTEVYLQIIDQILLQNKRALILVPEIGLTPQITERFQKRFQEPIAVLHSGLTDRERLDAWLQVKEEKIRIIIGTRSAVFTPINNLGIIIVDEEHDLSFKQQEGFRYHARDIAVMRAHLEKIPIVLGSATPSLESMHNVIEKRYQHLHLPERVGTAIHPTVTLLDLRNKKLTEGLSSELITKMQQHLQQDGQVLLFLNRRGFAPVLICHACNWVAACKRCDAKMTLHHQTNAFLQCHHCGSQRKPDRECPDCNNKNIMPLGLGTQRLEQTLQNIFPECGIIRIDRDSTRKKGSLENIFQSIHSGEHKILIGTQMLAKGHHFPNVTLVAILNTDNGLFSSEFRSTEKIAQLILQVAGRAGRAEKLGEVVIQTHHPDHALLQFILQQNYSALAKVILAERQATKLPPHAYIALIRAEAVDKNYPLQFLTELKAKISNDHSNQTKILGPIPSLMERKAGRYRAQLLLQAEKRSDLHHLLQQLYPTINALSSARRVRWSLDVDPQEVV
jgi:primosomal protein N' (replication factor Y)